MEDIRKKITVGDRESSKIQYQKRITKSRKKRK